jgi:hypothetical protein
MMQELGLCWLLGQGEGRFPFGEVTFRLTPKREKGASHPKVTGDHPVRRGLKRSPQSEEVLRGGLSCGLSREGKKKKVVGLGWARQVSWLYLKWSSRQWWEKRGI